MTDETQASAGANADAQLRPPEAGASFIILIS